MGCLVLEAHYCPPISSRKSRLQKLFERFKKNKNKTKKSLLRLRKAALNATTCRWSLRCQHTPETRIRSLPVPSLCFWTLSSTMLATPASQPISGVFWPSLTLRRILNGGLRFLALHNRAAGTYGIYRTFVERLLLWSWIFAGKSALTLNRNEFEQFVGFCKRPPRPWVGVAPSARFTQSDGNWTFNEGWRPFNIRSQPESKSYRPFTGTLRQIQSICSSFYNFLHAEDAAAVNPVVASRLQSGSADKADHPARRFLTSGQLFRVMQILEIRATGDPAGERALFIVAATVFLCLRATDLAASGEYWPSMDCFSFEDGS